ncbi:MAG TPA: BadF/BadG/BcrA/BcrD ATPase family protein [Steroidobacteraceae bacterium]
MRRYLGVDGGGSKTAFVLVEESGRVLAAHQEGPAYYLQTGMQEMRAMLARGIQATLAQAALTPAAVDFAFLGLPSYGEDSSLLATLDAAAAPTLAPGRFRCGNDAVCGWAGALAAQDGINVVAGTGSMAYGEYGGRTARAGGWGELFSDEGSGYWVAREGLQLFSRMSDGRAPRGPLYERLRQHFRLAADLDLCAAIYGSGRGERSDVAGLSAPIAEAARAGDAQAQALFGRAVGELVQLVDAVHDRLAVPAGRGLTVSHSGGMFRLRDLVLEPLRGALQGSGRGYEFAAARLAPAAGAALYAARTSGAPLDEQAVALLESQQHKVPGWTVAVP